ncbi:MAG: nucleotide exchange factor GrpE [Acidimicrobiales bacterium]
MTGNPSPKDKSAKSGAPAGGEAVSTGPGRTEPGRTEPVRKDRRAKSGGPPGEGVKGPGVKKDRRAKTEPGTGVPNPKAAGTQPTKPVTKAAGGEPSRGEPSRGGVGGGVAGGGGAGGGGNAAEPTANEDQRDIFTLALEDALGDFDAIRTDELARVAAERDEYLAALQRLKADYDNSRKRVERQQAETRERANQGLLTKLLPVLDALDLAIAHALDAGSEDAQSLVQIGTLLGDTLAREGLERIDAVGTRFDPTVHDAVAREPGTEQDGESADSQTVSMVLRAGYQLKGRVIRPAMVMVRG